MTVLGRNLVALSISQFATWGIAVVVAIIVPRWLGDVTVGQLAVAGTFVSFFELVGMLGTSTYLVKMIARDRSRAGPYVFHAFLLKSALAVGLSLVAIALGNLLGYSHETMVFIAIGCLGMTVNLLNDTFTSGLQGLERMAVPAFANVLRAYLGSAAALAALAVGLGVVGYLWAGVIAGALAVVINARAIWPDVRKHCRLDRQVGRLIVVGGLPFLLWSGVLLIYGTIDIPLLHALTDDATVGWYAVAFRWIGIPAFFSSLVVTAFMPSLSTHGESIGPRFMTLANRALRLVFFAAAPTAVGIALVSSDLMTLLYHGQFDNSATLMKILALHIPFVGMDMILGIILIAADRQRQWIFVGCGAIVLNLGLNFVAIPATASAFGNGAIGASAVTVLTEGLMMAGGILLRPKGVLDRPTASFLVRCGFASLPMLTVLAFVPDSQMLVKVAFGVVTYGVFSLLLGTVSLSQILESRQFLMSALGRRDGVALPSNTK